MYIILRHEELKSTDKFCNFDMEFDINTVKQLQKNFPPNVGEVGWIDLRYTDKFHHYLLLFKPNGNELGKKDCDCCTDTISGQKFLVTQSTPTLKLNTWNKTTVDIVGNHIKVYWNGKVIIDYIDKTMSPKLASG
jgi:hypothetical protein